MGNELLTGFLAGQGDNSNRDGRFLEMKDFGQK